MRRTLAVVTLVGLVALVTAGCGSDDDNAESGAAGHNQADVTFAQGMVPHHEQAIEMSDLALQKAGSAKVKDLATRIKAAQGPEIDQMKRWLEDWGASTDGGHDMAHMGMGAGMLSDADMKDLGAASGAAFDKLFLEGMIRHHEGAVKMADDELQDGRSPAAKQLAQRIKDTQNAEIAEMKSMLGA